MGNGSVYVTHGEDDDIEDPVHLTAPFAGGALHRLSTSTPRRRPNSEGPGARDDPRSSLKSSDFRERLRAEEHRPRPLYGLSWPLLVVTFPSAPWFGAVRS